MCVTCIREEVRAAVPHHSPDDLQQQGGQGSHAVLLLPLCHAQGLLHENGILFGPHDRSWKTANHKYFSQKYGLVRIFDNRYPTGNLPII